MFKIIYTESYNRKAKKFISKHPSMISQYKKTLYLMEQNPYHPSLRLHKLKGKLQEICSVSINLQYRITLYFIIRHNTIVPIEIGKHENVY